MEFDSAIFQMSCFTSYLGFIYDEISILKDLISALLNIDQIDKRVKYSLLALMHHTLHDSYLGLKKDYGLQQINHPFLSS